MNSVIRKTLQQTVAAKIRIKKKQQPKEIVDKKLFIEIIKALKEIEDRSDFLAEELGMDVTQYEEKYFLVIENLLKMHFKKEQLALIQYYVYQLPNEQEFDGTVQITRGKETLQMEFTTPEDLWAAIQIF